MTSTRDGAPGPRRSGLGWMVLCCFWLACVPDDPPRGERAVVPEGAVVTEWGDTAEAEAAAIEAPPPPPPTRPAPVFLPAAGPDPDCASDEPVTARRVVYRVRLGVPGILGSPVVELAVPAAELFIDVSMDRLRARFVGTGWPVDAGAEVRIRGDSPGAYVIDGQGGRPLEPGALSVWFEGGVPRPGPRAYVRRDPVAYDAPEPLVGTLICSLVAEWAAETRGSMTARCGHASPVGFRVGWFRGERTADVPVELPRSALCADERPPLPDVVPSTSRAFLEPSALGRLESDLRPSEEPEHRDDAVPVAEGLLVENQSDGRMIVVVDGVAVGWVEAGASGHFVGLAPGLHEVGSMRPGGAVSMRPRIIEVPGRTVLRHRPRRVEE